MAVSPRSMSQAGIGHHSPGPLRARCLVVEDDPAVSRLLEGRMSHEGYQVRTVADGAEVMAAVAEWHPDIILVDLMLPSVSGIELCRGLKSENSPDRQIPVVVVSAYSSPANRLACAEAGADAFIAKPFNGRSLAERMHQLISGSDVAH